MLTRALLASLFAIPGSTDFLAFGEPGHTCTLTVWRFAEQEGQGRPASLSAASEADSFFRWCFGKPCTWTDYNRAVKNGEEWLPLDYKSSPRTHEMFFCFSRTQPDSHRD